MNEMKTTNISKELEQFCDNLKRNGKYNMANDNLYELKSVDINGNVVDRKFGVNVVTNNGMYYYNKTTLGADYHISVGTGTGTPTTADTELFNKLDWVNVRSNVSRFGLPLRYDAITGIISSTRQVLEAYFDYNIIGIDSPTNITEFGMINYDNGSLTTHSLVYDEQGNPSFIIKNTNERLYVTVYFVTNFKEDLINNAWDNDCYAVIGNYDNDIKNSGRRNIIWTDYNRENSSSTNPRVYTTTGTTTVDENDDGNTIVNENVLIDFDIQGISSTIAGFSLTQPKGYQAGDFRITKRLKLQTPEQITLPFILTDTYGSKSFEQLFGHFDKLTGSSANYFMTGYYPLTDYNIETLMAYNSDTHEWDIPVPFSSPSNCDYCNYFDSPTRIYVNFNGDKYVSVYFNINLDLPILAFNYTNYPIYATDKYWDTSTYEVIPDVSNIPIELRNKKYYITETNDVKLIPTTVKHEVIPHKESYVIEGFDMQKGLPLASTALFVSEEYRWIINQTIISFINEDSTAIDYEYAIFTSGGQVPLFYNTGDIFIYWFNSKFNIIDTTTPSVEPVAEDLILDFGTGVSVGTPMFTFTDRGSGYVVCQHLTENKTVIIDLHGDTVNNRPTQYLLENTKHCNAILCTKYCVYQRSDITDLNTFEIYDMENRTIIDTFSLPSELTGTVTGIRAWSKFIYVLRGKTRLYNMDDRSLTTLPWSLINAFTTAYSVRPPTYAVEECMVFQPFNNYRFFIVSRNDHVTMPYITSPTTIGEQNILELKKIEFNGGTKILMSVKNPNALRMIYDIGFFIDNPANDFNVRYHNDSTPFIFYKNGYLNLSTRNVLRWYPIECMISYKATGTTRTVQSMNNRKNIKQPFSFKTTNDPNLWSIT